jgi:hypothetical protein
MDIGGSEIAAWIASSTSAAFFEYSPVFLLVGGIVLALGIIGALIDRLFPVPDDLTDRRDMRE